MITMGQRRSALCFQNTLKIHSKSVKFLYQTERYSANEVVGTKASVKEERILPKAHKGVT